jgi:hypothetical protein
MATRLLARRPTSLIHGKGKRFFLLRPARGPTQVALRWVPGAVSPGVKRQDREADHSPPSSSEIKNGGTTPSPPVRLNDVRNYLSLGITYLLPIVLFWKADHGGCTG